MASPSLRAAANPWRPGANGTENAPSAPDRASPQNSICGRHVPSLYTHPATSASATGLPSAATTLPVSMGGAGCVAGGTSARAVDTNQQTITGLTVGESYVLSWGYGDRVGSGQQQLDVSFGSGFGSLLVADIGEGSGLWTSNSYIVVATATSEVLEFRAIDTSNYGGNSMVGNEVAAVSLTAVPDPTTSVELVTMALGLLGFGLRRRR